MSLLVQPLIKLLNKYDLSELSQLKEDITKTKLADRKKEEHLEIMAVIKELAKMFKLLKLDPEKHDPLEFADNLLANLSNNPNNYSKDILKKLDMIFDIYHELGMDLGEDASNLTELYMAIDTKLTSKDKDRNVKCLVEWFEEVVPRDYEEYKKIIREKYREIDPRGFGIQRSLVDLFDDEFKDIYSLHTRLANCLMVVAYKYLADHGNDENKEQEALGLIALCQKVLTGKQGKYEESSYVDFITNKIPATISDSIERDAKQTSSLARVVRDIVIPADQSYWDIQIKHATRHAAADLGSPPAPVVSPTASVVSGSSTETTTGPVDEWWNKEVSRVGTGSDEKRDSPLQRAKRGPKPPKLKTEEEKKDIAQLKELFPISKQSLDNYTRVPGLWNKKKEKGAEKLKPTAYKPKLK